MANSQFRHALSPRPASPRLALLLCRHLANIKAFFCFAGMLCSVSMPADYEVSSFHRPPPPVRRPASLHLSVSVPVLAAPRRPCLVVRPEGSAEDGVQPQQAEPQAEQAVEATSATSPQSPTRLKKRVVFADDAGRQLTHVKVSSSSSLRCSLWLR